ncbi:hypothetical protein B0H16DRAFT_1471460 [Mycena metata]|uniref:Uncharacterized protein n=1 Tax=Mycena metata TaxID=1033252 RepID=A0AAD7HQW8_9AGAR|nr:hypothetical protein B0H16DRAFT_1471460 [Mycena metata]
MSEGMPASAVEATSSTTKPIRRLWQQKEQQTHLPMTTNVECGVATLLLDKSVRACNGPQRLRESHYCAGGTSMTSDLTKETYKQRGKMGERKKEALTFVVTGPKTNHPVGNGLGEIQAQVTRFSKTREWPYRLTAKTPQQGPTRVLFPTLETVRGTALGEGGAGTVFCRRGQWEKIRTLDDRAGLEMRDAKSRSGPVGMHTKATDSDTYPDATDPDSSDVEVVEIKPKRAEADEEEKRKLHEWIYVGSHNFMPSAWGSMTGSGFSPVPTVTNYELGVILRLETEEDAAAMIAWEHPACVWPEGYSMACGLPVFLTFPPTYAGATAQPGYLNDLGNRTRLKHCLGLPPVAVATVRRHPSNGCRARSVGNLAASKTAR